MAEIEVPSYNPRFLGMRIPIGGGGGDAVFDRITQEILPGTDLAIVTVNSTIEQDMYDYNFNEFRKAGFRGEVRHVHSSMDPNEAQMQLLDNVGGIYISGGNQELGLKRMQDLQIDTLIVELNKFGVVIAGTSAGCSELGEISPFDNTAIPGLDIIHGVIADQHFNRPKRPRRLSQLSEGRKMVGLGFDSGAALVIDPDGRAEFVGDGNVHVITPSNERAYDEILLGHDRPAFALQEWVAKTVYEAYFDHDQAA